MPQPHGQLSHKAVIVINGLPDSGKSYTVEQLTLDAFRVVWVTPEPGDFEGEGRLKVSPEELERYPAWLDDPHLRLKVQLHGDAEHQSEQLVRLVELFMRRLRGAVVAIDELGKSAPSDFGWGRRCAFEVERLAMEGRKRRIAVIVASQLVTDIPIGLRKAATEYLCLEQSHADELRELRRVYGESFANRVAAWRQRDPPIRWVRGKDKAPNYA